MLAIHRLLILTGTVGLLMPWLATPVMSDERYHYVSAPMRLHGSVLELVPWVANDMGWRMEAGRIAPVGTFMQHLSYLLGMDLATATGWPLWVVHALVKLLLLGAAVASFALLLRQLRRADGSPVTRRTRTSLLQVFTVLLVLGVTTALPGRNGWTTFVLLCVGGISVLFLTGAAALWTARRWAAWGVTGRCVAGVSLAVLGVAVMLSYELHWAAVPFAIVLVTTTGRISRAHRLATVVPLAAGWLAAVLWTRHLIAGAVDPQGIYPGLDIHITTATPRVFGLQVLNAVPGTGVPWSVVRAGDGLPTPWPFTGTGWLWGLLLATGLVLGRRRATARDDRPRDRGDAHPLQRLALALSVSLVSAAAILSVSVQAAQIVRFPGATYRGTPWIWACLAAIVGIALVHPYRRKALGDKRITMLLAAAAFLVGACVWPANVSAVQTVRTTESIALWERAQAELISGSTDRSAVEHRCLIAEQATRWAEQSAYNRAYLPLYERAFQYQWGRPWCPTPPSTS